MCTRERGHFGFVVCGLWSMALDAISASSLVSPCPIICGIFYDERDRKDSEVFNSLFAKTRRTRSTQMFIT